MDTQTKTILALSQGTRYLGLAVISGTGLSDWKVKTLRGQWSPVKLKKALRIVGNLIDNYRPAGMALKRVHPARTSLNLQLLTNRILRLASKKRIKTLEFSISDLKKHHSGKEIIQNRKQLAESLAALYPDLHFDLEKEKRNRNPYYSRMFEAVALASLLHDKNHNF